MHVISLKQMHCVAGGLMSEEYDQDITPEMRDAAYCGVSVGAAVITKTPVAVATAVNDCIPIATVVVTATAEQVAEAKAELGNQFDNFMREMDNWFQEQIWGGGSDRIFGGYSDYDMMEYENYC